MAFVALKRILCCCTADDEHDANQVNESSHLIPSQEEPNVSYSNALLQLQMDQRKLRERLGLIVRAKEGKMVNVGSQLPFNLHNQVIPEQETHGSISRSASRSDVSGYYDSHQADYRYQNHQNSRQRGHGFTLRSRSASPSGTPSGVITDQPTPNPILNVRWIGFTPKRVSDRGRQKERKTSQSGTPKSEEEEEHSGATSSSKSPTTLKLRDAGSLSMSWGD